MGRRSSVASACAVSLGPVCGLIGLGPQNADGRVKVKLNDWGLGYNLGLLLQPVETTHLGVSYRSAVRHDLSGTAQFLVPAAALPLRERHQEPGVDQPPDMVKH